ncbi:MAG: chitobiase/beta-hexosaminidase C-terminal domain-containing protein [Eubacterium sp.]|nr:chitobiase/beta-hexosaminidase C-terminal domain-containing protein [Eubacterium sp.]
MRSLFAVIITIALILGIMPMMSITARAEENTSTTVATLIYKDNTKTEQSTTYTDFSEAVTAWNAVTNQESEVVLKLNANVETSSTVEVTGGTESYPLELDLNGYGLIFTGDEGSVVSVSDVAYLNIVDSDPSKTNYVITKDSDISMSKTYSDNDYRGTQVSTTQPDSDASYVTVSGGCITGGLISSTSNTGAGITNNGVLCMKKGTVCANVMTYSDGDGVGVYNNGTFNLEGGTICNNIGHKVGYMTICGGGVGNFNDFIMTGGTISNNYASCDGGGVYNHGAFVLDGGTIESNTSYTNGGGVETIASSGNDGKIEYDGKTYGDNATSVFAMLSGTIRNNKATYGGGGGIYRAQGSFYMLGGDVTGNTAVTGGGIQIVEDYYTSLRGGKITNNHATRGVGGICLAGSTEFLLYISGDPVVKNNTAGSSNITSNLVDVRYSCVHTIEIDKPLTYGAYIGIAICEDEESKGTDGFGIFMEYCYEEIRSNLSSYELYFHPDNSACTMINQDGQLFLRGDTTTAISEVKKNSDTSWEFTAEVTDELGNPAKGKTGYNYQNDDVNYSVGSVVFYLLDSSGTQVSTQTVALSDGKATATFDTLTASTDYKVYAQLVGSNAYTTSKSDELSFNTTTTLVPTAPEGVTASCKISEDYKYYTITVNAPAADGCTLEYSFDNGETYGSENIVTSQGDDVTCYVRYVAEGGIIRSSYTEVDCEAYDQPGTPTITRSDGSNTSNTFMTTDGLTVKINPYLIGQKVLYTTDGSEPTPSNYEGIISQVTSITIDKTTTFKLVGYKNEDCILSETVIVTYTAIHPALEESKVSIGSAISADQSHYDVTVNVDKSEDAIEYSFDGGKTYSSNNTAVSNGNEQVTCYVRYAATDDYEASDPITVSTDITGGRTATPEISGSESFTDSTTITIAAKEGETIYYTTDGTEPNAMHYSGKATGSTKLNLTATTTVKACAVADGQLSSEVVSAKFTKENESSDNDTNTYINDGESSNNTSDKKSVTKKTNTLTVKAKKAKVKYKKLKKNKQTLKVSKVLTVKKAKGSVTYAKKSGNKKIEINKKTGKVTIKKGLKKGTYRVKVKVKAAGNAKYKSLTKTVTFKIVVK